MKGIMKRLTYVDSLDGGEKESFEKIPLPLVESLNVPHFMGVVIYVTGRFPNH